MLIGNLGKDPQVRYYEADQAVAQFSLATTERGYTMEHRCLTVPTGIMWWFGKTWLRWLNAICIKAIRCISRGKFTTAATTTEKVSDSILPRFMPIVWSCSRHVQQLTPHKRMGWHSPQHKMCNPRLPCRSHPSRLGKMIITCPSNH